MLESMQATKGAKTFQIRGKVDDEAVLVSGDKTYSVRTVESSNQNMLVLPVNRKRKGEASTRIVAGSITQTYELTEILPKLPLLRELLSSQLYRGEKEDEEEDNIHLYTLQQLQRTIQCSNKQLDEGLAAIHACEIDGYWRMLDPSFVNEVFNMTLLLAAEKEWDYSQISVAQASSEMKEYPVIAIENCLRMHADTEKTKALSPHTYCLDPTKICLFRYGRETKQNELSLVSFFFCVVIVGSFFLAFYTWHTCSYLYNVFSWLTCAAGRWSSSKRKTLTLKWNS